mmetsp:Transcript_36880/g.94303  ORF Transcript_36880/g.94303 Transcript_36880/m.94303 type:complete len:209 (-) Transcript_36880:53-679(-)
MEAASAFQLSSAADHDWVLETAVPAWHTAWQNTKVTGCPGSGEPWKPGDTSSRVRGGGKLRGTSLTCSSFRRVGWLPAAMRWHPRSSTCTTFSLNTAEALDATASLISTCPPCAASSSAAAGQSCAVATAAVFAGCRSTAHRTRGPAKRSLPRRPTSRAPQVASSSSAQGVCSRAFWKHAAKERAQSALTKARRTGSPPTQAPPGVRL